MQIADVRWRRNCVVAGPSGEGLLTGPSAATDSPLSGLLFMPHCGHCLEPVVKPQCMESCHSFPPPLLGRGAPLPDLRCGRGCEDYKRIRLCHELVRESPRLFQVSGVEASVNQP
jgi:hypothetical protein